MKPINLRAAFYGTDAKSIVNWLVEVIPEAGVDERILEGDFRIKKGWIEAVGLVGEWYDNPDFKDLLEDRLLLDFKEKVGVGPSDVEKYLGCTTRERKRWEEEGRLPVVDRFDTGTRREPIWVPMYDRKVVKLLMSSPDTIESWRTEHEANKALNRRIAEETAKMKNEMTKVEIVAYATGKSPYQVFGPVFAENEDKISEIWEREKVKLPFEFEDMKVSVIMRDVITDKILRMEFVNEAKLDVVVRQNAEKHLYSDRGGKQWVRKIPKLSERDFYVVNEASSILTTLNIIRREFGANKHEKEGVEVTGVQQLRRWIREGKIDAELYKNSRRYGYIIRKKELLRFINSMLGEQEYKDLDNFLGEKTIFLG